jgi:hypothetical protein
MKRLAVALLVTIGFAALGFGVGGGVSALFVRGSAGFEGAAAVAVGALCGTMAGCVAGLLLARRIGRSAAGRRRGQG